MRRNLFGLVAALSLGSGLALCEDVRTVTITVENRTPAFDVVPSIEVFGSPPKPFDKAAQNTYVYKFEVPDSDWFKKVDIHLLWKNDFLTANDKKDDFNQRISLRIRRDFPTNFTFPVFFSNSRSRLEMDRLEALTNINDQFEVFFRSWQILSYYRSVLGGAHALSRRAAKILFYSAIRLAEEPDYFVIMSDVAEKHMVESVMDGAIYSERASQARSVYWFDLKLIDGYVKKGDCGTAQLLLAAFQSLKTEDPVAFKLRFKGDSGVLDQKGIIVAKCAGR
jgi:hypothetical protein